MTPNPVGLAAGFALAANALIIPSTVSLSRDTADNLKSLDISSVSNGPNAKHNVHLACPGCSFPSAPDAHVDNSMLLTFSTSDTHQEFLLNDYPIFGDSLHSDALGGLSITNEIAIPQIDSSGSPADGTLEPRSFGYQWQRKVSPAGDGTDAQLITIDMQIMSLADQQVSTDDLSLRILKDESDNLRIADVVKIPREGPTHHETGEEEEEKQFNILPISGSVPRPGMGHDSIPKGRICKVKAMLAAKVQAIKAAIEAARARAGATSHHGRPCPKKMQGLQNGTPIAPPPGHWKPAIPIKGGVAKFWAWKTNAQDEPPHSEEQQSSEEKSEAQNGPQDGSHRPMNGHHHGGHHRNCRMIRFARVLHRFLTGFLLPVLVGIAAGITASLLGMIVGSALAMLWFMIVRRGRKGSASVRDEPPAEQADAHEAAMEKQGLMAVENDDESDAESLPAYQEKE